MTDATGLLAIMSAFFIVTISPGPANLAIATIAMSTGKNNALRFGLGLSLGLALWGVVAATGLGAVLEASTHALTLLKLIGGVYLLWLAWQSSKSARNPVADETSAKHRNNNSRWFVRGFLLNLSNPKAVFAWMAALSMGLNSGTNYLELISATLICMVIGLLNYTGYALLFSRQKVMFFYRKIQQLVDGLVAGIFAFAGFAMIKSALSRN